MAKNKNKRSEVKLSANMLREVARSAADANAMLHRMINGLLPNPDDLVGRKGLIEYERMRRRDPVIRNGLLLLKLARLSVGFTIQSPDGWEEFEPRMPEMVDLINYNIEHMKGEFYDMLRQMYICLDYGYSITEKLYTIFPDGPFEGKWGIKKLKTKRSRDFRFNEDEFGNLKPMGLVQKMSGILDKTPLDPAKFLIFTFMMEESNRYGESLLRPCYRSYKSKDLLIRFWNIAAERFGMPTPFITMDQDNNWSDEDDEEGRSADGLSDPELAVLNLAMKNLQAGMGGILPPGAKLDTLKALQGKLAFESAIKTHNQEMLRGLLTPSLMGGEGQQSGNRSLSKTHMETFLFIVKNLGITTQELLDEDYIRQIVDFNFAQAQMYPRFLFDKITDEKEKAFLEVIDRVLKRGVVEPNEPFIRERLGIPPKEDQEQEPGKEPEPEPKPVPEVKPDKVEQGNLTEIESYMLNHIVPYYSRFTPPIAWPRHEGFRGYVMHLERADYQKTDEIVLKRPKRSLSPVEKATDFKGLAQTWNDLFRSTVDKVMPLFEDVYDDVRKKARKVMETGDIKELKRMQLKAKPFGDFRKVMQSFYVSEFVEGARSAVKEVETKTKEKIKPFGTSDKTRLFERALEFVLTPDEAIEWLTTRAPTLKSQLPIYTSQAFTVSGIEKERILAEVQIALQKALSRGASVKQTMQAVDDIFNKYRATGEIIGGELSTPNRLETIVRTNLGLAYNAGRKAAFESPGVAQFLEAYQYSAVLDPRTTDFCVDHDGVTRPINDLIWDVIWPPNHFNCRSIVVSVIKGEEWARTQNLPTTEPASGFKFEVENE